MLKIKTIIILIFSSLTLGLSMAPVTSFAAVNCANPASPKEQLQCGACGGSGLAAANCDPGKAAKTVNGTIRNVINILSGVAGVVAVVMIIVSGFRYVSSAGNDQAIASAKRSLIWAIIGLVIVALAQIIARFTLHTVTSG